MKRFLLFTFGEAVPAQGNDEAGMSVRVRSFTAGVILHYDSHIASRHGRGGQRYTAADHDLLLQSFLDLDEFVSILMFTKYSLTSASRKAYRCATPSLAESVTVQCASTKTLQHTSGSSDCTRREVLGQDDSAALP